MDVARLRKRFPTLRSGKGIYLDNAATSLTPETVINEVARYWGEYNVNAGRGAYLRAARLTAELEEAREAVADFIGAQPEEIVFTYNTTDGINRLASSFPFKPGDSIALTRLEHHSNLLPWSHAARRNSLKIEIIPATSEGIVDLEKARKILGSRPKLFAVTAASNVLGTVQPINKLVTLAKANGVRVLIDAAQWAGHRPLDIKELECDFLAFSAHKMYGPHGVGVLYVSKEAQQVLEPAYLGGGTVRAVTDSDYILKDFPQSFEAGTLNLAGILGFKAAVEFLEEIGLAQVEDRTSKLHAFLQKGLRASKRIEVYTSEGCDNVGITAFNINGTSSHEAALQYDRLGGIMLRSGFHCAIPLVKTLGKGQGTLRASLAFYNTEQEIEKFLEITERIAKEA